MNQQGPDVGSQYRSVIFYHDLDQKAQAEKAKMLLDESGAYEDAVVTEIVPAEVFYPAEAHHQKYLEKQGLLACDFVSPAQKKEK